MKRMRSALVFAMLLLPGSQCLHAQALSVAERYLLAAANGERSERGLPVLRWDDALHKAAMRHAAEMAARQNISHRYPGEADLGERAKIAGVRFSIISENVAEAGTAVRIHDLWMNSPGHRANLLDPQVDAVGISVVQRGGQLYAVQDFERSVETLTLEQQEQKVALLVSASARVALLPTPNEARETCTMESGYAGKHQPAWIIRYSGTDVARLPDALQQKLASGQYARVAVGACESHGPQTFSTYNIVVMLYR